MKYYIYWDEDYNGSDRDSLLEVAKTLLTTGAHIRHMHYLKKICL